MSIYLINPVYSVYALYHNFVEVQINFLVVGHTHEDIDQFFSKISKKIKMSGCESLQGLYLCVALLLLCIFALDLMKRIQESCKARPVCQILDGVWDFKDWMKHF